MKKTCPLLVYLKKDPKRPPAAAIFAESIVDALRNTENACGDTENAIYVECETIEDGLVLNGFRHGADVTKKILLRRPPFCPITMLRHGTDLEQLPDETKTRGVHIGVAVILESSDHNVLLTRRSKTMRTFPRVWVPPGGHIDHGEALYQAGMRELWEETGIKIEDGKDTTSILGLWESAFPPKRHLGLPTRHHIVVYLHHKAKETASQISEQIHLETNEVDACTWLCSCVTENIVVTDSQFSIENANETTPKRCHSYPKLCVKRQEYIYGVLIDQAGLPKKGNIIPTAPLFAQVGETSDNERVSTGTKYALKLWLNLLQKAS